MKFIVPSAIQRIAWICLMSTACALNAADARAKQQELIALIQSDAPPADKAIACKELAVYGNSDAVAVLVPLLSDERLSSWARIPLEAIPGSAADAGLRQALGKLQGHLLVGVINSIGVRRDPQAVEGLIARLPDPDIEIASAAAVALGRIGNAAATEALKRALSIDRPPVRSAVAQGAILCAEKFMAGNQWEQAIALYDTLRNAALPRQRKLEATRGAILARQSAGIPLLLEQLRSSDKAFFGIGLRAARELPGRDVTDALAAELTKLPAERQPLALQALADRKDAAVLPALLKAARGSEPGLRLSAVKLLGQVGDVTCVPTLLESASASDTALAKAASISLVRLHTPGVDDALLARLGQATGALRPVLIRLMGQRHLDRALPTIAEGVKDSDPAVRRASLEAMSAMGGANQLPGLVELITKAQSADRREELEGTLLDVSSRAGAVSASKLLPLARSPESDLRVIGLHALAGVGGSEALQAVRAAIQDPVEVVQDEAVRTLSTWPNSWPDDVDVAEPLLALAKSGKKRSHEVLGFRGYMQYLQADKRLKDADRVARVADAVPLMKGPEEKQAAFAVLSNSRTPASLDLLTKMATDSASAEEAYSAIVILASKDIPGVSKDQRQQALRRVIDGSKNDAIKQRAEQAAKGIK